MHVIDPAKLPIVLTSCGRFDLLEQTINSFFAHYSAARIIVAEDSDQAGEAITLAEKFPAVDMRMNAPKIGQMRSIDKLYATLTTPYVVHLEDDWRFTRGLDLDSVIAFLESRPDISVACIAHRVFDPRYAKYAHRLRYGAIDYLVWDLDAHPRWFSYSFNPSIARLSLWREIGPFARFVTEENLSQFLKEQGKRIAMVVPGTAEHIGDKRHASDPFQPPRARTVFARLRRSIAKRWAQPRGSR